LSRTFRHFSLMLTGPVVLVIATFIYYNATAHYVSTDNAYIKQSKVSVSAEVSGRIIEVAVRENQKVQMGDLLFRIDPEPYRLAVSEAEAVLAGAIARVEELQSVYSKATVDIKRANDDIAYYEREYQRQLKLSQTSVTSRAALQAAAHTLSEARSDLAAARADATRAKATLSTGNTASGVNPMILSAQVQLKKAQLDLNRTVIRAPAEGIISQTDRLQVGQLITQGLPAVSIIKVNNAWIVANFKETDLEEMHSGQPATIEIDSYPDITLNGRVDSIGAGTGSEFAILPAQNANANWVKVTQRVPVRITFDDQPARPLIAGLSVHVRIDTSQ